MPGRSIHKPVIDTFTYSYSVQTLTDLLSKREYLYRNYLKTKSLTYTLPKYLVASPNNPLLLEIKNSFQFIDPSTFSNEVSRDFLYQNSSFLTYNILRDTSDSITTLFSNYNIPLNIINDYFVYYLIGNNKPSKLGSNIDFYKNQYRPMRKGITNMIRLHTTGAVAMPIEIRLHILTSSKDVIHS
jgi:hypothetical protein